MAIKFAGQDVLLESAPLAKFFDGELPRDWHGEHSQPLTSRAQTITAEFNWPWPPLLPEQFHIGELYWPTGAQRFSQCWLLATTEQKDAILEGVADAGSAQLEMDTGGTTIEATMYLLPPRQLTGAADLWLLPLVDQRYWWQFSSTKDDLVITQGTTTWADVIDILKTQLVISSLTTSDIASAYLYPDTETLTQYGGNCAALLDCVANSLGMRVVVKLDETVALESPDDGLGVLTANRAKDYYLTCGGPFEIASKTLPEKVSVTFRERNFNTQQIQGAAIYDQAAVGVPATLLVSGTVKRINSTCYADVTNAGFGNTPDNNTALTSLATQIAADYYNGLTEQYEYKFNSFIAWTPCFYDDYVMWSAGALERCAESPDDRIAGVRVRSYPVNYGPDQQFQQGNFPGLTPGYPPPPNAPLKNYTWQAYLSANTTISSTDPANPTEVGFDTLDTTVIQGSIFSLASNELTIAGTGVFIFSAVLPMVFTSPAAAVGESALWIQVDDGGGWDDILHSGGAVAVFGSVAAQHHGTITLTRLIKVTSGYKYRIVGVVTQAALGNPEVLSNADTSFPNVNTGVVSAVWSVTSAGDIVT